MTNITARVRLSGSNWIFMMISSCFIARHRPTMRGWNSSLMCRKRSRYGLLINATQANDYGKYQVTLNGVKLGKPLDFYSDKLTDHEFHLLDFWPEPGSYTLRLECVGKNKMSDGYYCGIESVRLRERRPRVTEYGFDKDKDWKEKPMLYR